MTALAWALGTFHATVVGLALLLLAYPGGGLGVALGGLSTVTGLALFVALWATTVFATGRAFAGLDLVTDGTAGRGFYRRALRWGGANGVLFLWSFAAILALQQAVTAPGTLSLQTLLLGAGFVVGIGSLFAFTFGAVIGLGLASIDLVALALARAIARG